jgi:hypothetical protein
MTQTAKRETEACRDPRGLDADMHHKQHNAEPQHRQESVRCQARGYRAAKPWPQDDDQAYEANRKYGSDPGRGRTESRADCDYERDECGD